MMEDISDRIDSFLRHDLLGNGDWLPLLIPKKLDRLPMPGEVCTLERWRALAVVGQFDLSLTKLYEGHTDALAILEEIDRDGMDVSPGAWRVWAAEAPRVRAVISLDAHGGVILNGAKNWCSGAATADHALLTAWEEDGSGPHLVAVSLDQTGIAIDHDSWKVVGMAGSMSLNVTFNSVTVRRVGKPGEYLNRPGFWHGGTGITACWYGGAAGLAWALKKSLLACSHDANGYKMAALGKVKLAMQETAAVLRQSARWMDDHPALDASHIALTTCLSAEKCAKRVIDEVGKALGATPLRLNEKFAKAMADLPVFIRQSHADRDFAALGERSLKGVLTWTL